MNQANFGLLFWTLYVFKIVSAGTILEELNYTGASKLAEYFEKANLSTILSGNENLTLFAPLDEAFDSLPGPLRDDLETDVDLLQSLLKYHIVPKRLPSKSLDQQNEVQSLEGSILHVNLYLKSDFYKGFITANGVRVIKSDWESSNGIIHFIDTVIHPIARDTLFDVLVNEGNFSFLLKAFEAADLNGLLQNSTGPYTLFAPSDDAFEKIPSETLDDLFSKKSDIENVLKMHMLPGTLFAKAIAWSEYETLAGGQDRLATQVFKGPVLKVATKASSGNVVKTNLVARNGVIHVIDTLL